MTARAEAHDDVTAEPLSGHATVPRWVLAALRGDGTATLVYVALAVHRRARDGRAWPSVARLAELCGVCVRTVSDALRRLETAGAIVRDVAEKGRPVVFRLPAMPEEPRQPTAAPLGSLVPTLPRQPIAEGSAKSDTGPRQPAADRTELLEQTPSSSFQSEEGAARATTTTPTTTAPHADRFTEPAHREAYLAVRRGMTPPDGFDATLAGMASGIAAPGGVPVSWWRIGFALHDLWGNKQSFNAQLFRGYLAKAPAEPSPRDRLARLLEARTGKDDPRWAEILEVPHADALRLIAAGVESIGGVSLLAVAGGALRAADYAFTLRQRERDAADAPAPATRPAPVAAAADRPRTDWGAVLDAAPTPTRRRPDRSAPPRIANATAATGDG